MILIVVRIISVTAFNYSVNSIYFCLVGCGRVVYDLCFLFFSAGCETANRALLCLGKRKHSSNSLCFVLNNLVL